VDGGILDGIQLSQKLHITHGQCDSKWPLRYHSSMTQALIRGGTPAVIVGILIIAAAVASVTISWHRSDPATKAGRLRRSLDAVRKETERRDREIDELTGTPVGK
jgi:hypothetical protein